jgi:hypothetical protein
MNDAYVIAARVRLDLPRYLPESSTLLAITPSMQGRELDARGVHAMPYALVYK